MPRLSVWFVRASLVYLAVGCALGGLMLAEKGMAYLPPVWFVLPIHVEFLLVGWLMQMAMGVAFWILPRFNVGSPRGDEGPIWVSFMMINSGVLLVAIQSWLPIAWLVGRLAEIGAALIFAGGTWRRVKPSPGQT